MLLIATRNLRLKSVKHRKGHKIDLKKKKRLTAKKWKEILDRGGAKLKKWGLGGI